MTKPRWRLPRNETYRYSKTCEDCGHVLLCEADRYGVETKGCDNCWWIATRAERRRFRRTQARIQAGEFLPFVRPDVE